MRSNQSKGVIALLVIVVVIVIFVKSSGGTSTTYGAYTGFDIKTLSAGSSTSFNGNITVTGNGASYVSGGG